MTERISKYSDEMKKEYINFLCNKLRDFKITYNKDLEDVEPEFYKTIASYLLNELQYSSFDPYQLVCNIEVKFQFNGNVNFIQCVSEIPNEITNLYLSKLTEWVKIHNIEPELEIGTEIVFTVYDNNGSINVMSKEIPGVISNIYKETAQYGITSEIIERCDRKNKEIVIPYEYVKRKL